MPPPHTPHTPPHRHLYLQCARCAARHPFPHRHVAALYGLLAAKPDANIFRELDPGQWREVRRVLIAAVLHTDMVHHFTMVSKVGGRAQRSVRSAGASGVHMASA